MIVRALWSAYFLLLLNAQAEPDMVNRMMIPRLGQLVLLFLLIAVLGFLLLHAAPGNPARQLVGLNATPSQVASERQALGLDKPLIVQLLSWIGHLFTGNLGTSYADHQPVTSVLAEDAAPTIQLALSAFVIAVVVGIPLGVRSGLRPGGRTDKLMRVYSPFAIAVPSFVLGVLLVLVFGWWWPHVLPYQGYVSVGSDPWQAFLHTILPALCLAAAPIGIVARQTRTSMIEVLGQEYITAARSLGVSEREIIWKDALKPALLPVLTVLGLLVGLLLSGTVIIENVFAIPGLGRQLVSAFTARDYPVAIGVLLVFATAFLVINFVTDLAYAVVNPRVRRAYAQQA